MSDDTHSRVLNDSRVSVEGNSGTVDLSTLAEDINVVRWYGTVGEIEFKTDHVKGTRKMNERTESFAPDAWEVEVKKGPQPAV